MTQLEPIRQVRQMLDKVPGRAERRRREREVLAAQRVQQERQRIARELHDVVAHSISLMVIQAGAARRHVTSDPAQVVEMLQGIEQTGRTAMGEMRRMLGVLRGADGADIAAQPLRGGLAAVGDLLSAARDLPVSLHAEGAVDALPPDVELSAYRVVQEALTNVRCHAGSVNQVEVVIRRGHGTLVVEVVDDGRGAGEDAGRGYGIVGMHERVEALGGTVHAGPGEHGGWRVLATFPLAGR